MVSGYLTLLFKEPGSFEQFKHRLVTTLLVDKANELDRLADNLARSRAGQVGGFNDHVQVCPGKVIEVSDAVLLELFEHSQVEVERRDWQGFFEKCELKLVVDLVDLRQRDRLAGEVERRLSLPENLDKFVEIVFERGAEEITITIADQGPGFDWDKTADPRDEQNLVRTSGRGIFFMKSFVDTVSFENLPGKGTQVLLEKKLEASARGQAQSGRHR